MENNLPIRTNTENSPAPMVMLVPVGQQAYKPNNKHYTNMKHLATIRAFSGLAIAFGILSIALQVKTF